MASTVWRTTRRGSNKCLHHPSQDNLYICRDCKDLVCNQCASTTHKKHSMKSLDDIIPQAKGKLLDFVDRMENREKPRIQVEMKRTENELSNNGKYYHDLVDKIETQNNVLKQELDKITEKFATICRDAEKENAKILLKYKMELQSLADQTNSQIQQCRDVLGSGTNVQVYELSEKVSSEFKLPDIPTIKTMDFATGEYSLAQLEHCFGEMSTMTKALEFATSKVQNLDEYQKVAVENSTKYSRPNSSFSNHSDFPSSRQYLDVQCSIVSEFSYSKLSITTLHTTPDNKAWVCFSPREKLTLFDQHGEEIKSMKLDKGIKDFSLSSSTGNIWVCSHIDNSIREVTENKSTIKFHTASVPFSIYVTSDDHIVIGTEHRITKSTQKGKTVCSTAEETTTQSPEVIYPYRITESSTTGNLAVIDTNSKFIGGNGRPYILIMDDKLQPLYTYHGGRPSSAHRGSVQPFDPWDICYTASGDLLIADWSNRSVLMVNGSGQYIQTVYSNSKSAARRISVQSDGILWATFNDKTVKLLKPSEEVNSQQ